MDSNNKLFLLDAYALIYRAYYALIKNPRINSKGQNTSAIMGFVNTLEEILTKEDPSHIGVAFDPAGPTFRHEAYEEYKAQREATPEDIKLSVPYIKQIIKAYNIPILEISGYEADDVIGTLAKKASEKGFTTYMMTPDKDYAQLVDEHTYMYKPKHLGGYDILGVKEVLEKYQIETPGQVIDLLGLMGDSADNIPGCPGVGPKTAQKLIAEYGSIENMLEKREELKGALKKKIDENVEQIKFSKFLATIKTDVPVEFNPDKLVRESMNIEELTTIFEELEFKTLLKRILKREGVNENTDAPQNSSDGQGELFSSNLTENSTNISEESASDLYLSDSKSIKDGTSVYYIVDNKIDIKNILKNILTNGFVSLGVITDNTEPMQANLLGLSLSVKKERAYYIPLPPKHEEVEKILKLLAPVLEDEKIEKIGQDLKYKMVVLQKYGIELKGKLFDTMIAHYVVQPELRHSREYLAEIYLNYKTITAEELLGPKGKNQRSFQELAPMEVYQYACEDADIVLQLKDKLEEDLKEKGALELFNEIEMPLIPVLVNIETNGVRLDTESLKATSEEFTARLNQIEQKIHEYAGKEFNVGSPKQVGEVLFDDLKISEKAKKTKTGQYVTSEEVLESYRSKHPIVEEILNYRGLKKLLSTYIDALPQLINPATGRIHTSFNQAVTATGRLSSSNPNLQNIPIRDENGREIRKAFIPDDGCEFFSADYSQIELRIMAHLSKDANMIEAFCEGDDIHAATAAKVYNIPLSEVTSDMRRKAKTANFGIIYGISVFGLAERMGVSRQEAKELIDGYFKTYPQVKEYMDRSIEVAKKQEYVETIFNRKRYLPDINSRNAVVRGYAERNAINAPIQGSAADIIKVAMVNIYRRFEKENIKAKMILQVHDELNFSVPTEEKERVQKIVLEEMEGAYKMAVPLKADCGWGKNWLEAH